MMDSGGSCSRSVQERVKQMRNEFLSEHQLDQPQDITARAPGQLAKRKAEEINQRRKELVKKIELITLQMISDMKNEVPLMLSHPHTSDWSQTEFEDDRLSQAKEIKFREVKMSSKQSLAKLSLMIRLLSKAHSFLVNGTSATKRELYYQFLLSNQWQLDQCVVGVSSILDAAPWELGILSTAKGIVAGDLAIVFSDEKQISCKIGIAIPSDVHMAVDLKSPALFVLIVEKDAIFHKLNEQNTLKHLQPFILITGKGYPDLATRQLVKMIWDKLKIPIFILVDADPHGFDIMCTYRFGSMSMCQFSMMLTVPNILWLGVHPSDIKKLLFHENALLPYSKNDLELAAGLLQRPYVINNEVLKKEVEIMLALKFKAEIEALDSFGPNFMTDLYIGSKIVNKQCI